jgi:catechol 2,3-dioxygenase-like lactoylglutathione lyase family enzyme
MQQRLHIVTLGVSDVERAAAFYERLGWVRAPQSTEAIVFFDLGGMALGLFARTSLAQDARQSPEGDGFRGFTLAHNVASPAEVDTTLAAASEAGAVLVKPAQAATWGGYSGYFADPDGTLWEIAYNPFFTVTEAGHLHLAAPGSGRTAD